MLKNDPQTNHWYLERLDGGGLRVAVDQFPFLIGRGDECQIQPSSEQVSRLHAELRASSAAHYLFLVDHGSTNGTFLNGHRVTEAVPVNRSDVLRFGDEEWKLCEGGSRHAGGTRQMKPFSIDGPDNPDGPKTGS